MPHMHSRSPETATWAEYDAAMRKSHGVKMNLTEFLFETKMAGTYAFAQRIIREGKVTVNKNVIHKKDTILHDGDLVIFGDNEETYSE